MFSGKVKIFLIISMCEVYIQSRNGNSVVSIVTRLDDLRFDSLQGPQISVENGPGNVSFCSLDTGCYFPWGRAIRMQG
jgi:hypothetical protein